MYDLNTIRKLNRESGDTDAMAESSGMTESEIHAAADAERDMDAENLDKVTTSECPECGEVILHFGKQPEKNWPEPRNEF